MRYAISYDSIQEYVLDNDLKEDNIIVLHPDDYDIVATEFADENNVTIYRSFKVLGISVIEDTTHEVKRNNIFVMESTAF